MATPTTQDPVHLVNRRLAAALVLLGLLLQAAAPYLAMPVGGRLAAGPAIQASAGWVPICLSRALGGRDPDQRQAPHPADCPACLVMAQAVAILAPGVPLLPTPLALELAAALRWQQPHADIAASAGFSSRAPPVPA